MNRIYGLCLLGALLIGAPELRAQSTEIQQLLLNVTKLNQLNATLDDMKKGYTILVNGYNRVKSIAEGNFSLHEVFLDGLMQVSPTVRQYYRVADIIRQQQAIVRAYRSAYDRFRTSGNFTPGELRYISTVYSRLFARSMDNLDALLTVITASQLRMNDEERLGAIDRIFDDMQDKLDFLRYFNSEAGMMDMLRSNQKKELDNLGKIYGK